MKFLTVIAPNGLIMLVSGDYGGRASDKFITRKCKMEGYLCPGDTIMADGGFKLDPHLEVQRISMNVPALTKVGYCATCLSCWSDCFVIAHKETPAVRGRSD